MEDIKDKYGIYIGITLKALSYRDKPLEMIDFIEKYNEFFPTITKEKIEIMRKEINEEINVEK